MSWLRPPAALLFSCLVPLFFFACAGTSSSNHSASSLPGGPDSTLTVIDGDTTYRIKRHPIATPGDKYDVHCLNEYDVSVTAADPDPAKPPITKNEVETFELAGRLEVAAIDAQGSPTAWVLTIAKCIGPHGGELVAPGQTIDIKQGPKIPHYSLRGGGKLPTYALQALSSLHTNGDIGDGSADDPASADLPRKIGDAWPIHIDPKGDGALSTDPDAQATDMRGQTTLKAIETFNGIKALRLETALAGKVTMHNLPLGISADKSDMKIDQTNLIALDRSLPPIESEMTLEMHIALGGSFMFVPVKMQTTTIIRQKQTSLPLPQSPATNKG